MGADMARGFNYAPGASSEVAEALQPGLHKTHIMALGSSRNVLVRAAVAGREDCPLGLMVSLAHDYSAEVRCAVARNSHAQRTVMAYLSADRSVDVLKALLENPSLPPDLVEELAFHKKAEVRKAAADRLDAGDFAAPERQAEDSHTPELAEHVVPQTVTPEPIAPPQTMPTPVPVMTADGAFAPVFPQSNVVDIATGAPVSAPAYPATPSAFPAAPAPQPEPAQAHAVPQIFAPHSTADAPAPTRTAPVRGFKPPTN
jgi:hypothetical protein